jgi:predicted transcriptional regulator
MNKQAEKVLSVMPEGRPIPLSEICALSGFSQDRALQILQALKKAGRVKRFHPDELTEPQWWRV